MLEEEGVYGSVHIGIGANITLGGHVKAAIHCDLLMWEATIQLDCSIVVLRSFSIAFSTITISGESGDIKLNILSQVQCQIEIKNMKFLVPKRTKSFTDSALVILYNEQS